MVETSAVRRSDDAGWASSLASNCFVAQNDDVAKDRKEGSGKTVLCVQWVLLRNVYGKTGETGSMAGEGNSGWVGVGRLFTSGLARRQRKCLPLSL
jgi:hypothetical protein